MVEQTRLIAHEVRNALIPVRHQLDALLAMTSDPQRARVQASRLGVVQVLEFVEEMIDTSELVNTPVMSFDIADVVCEALGLLEDGGRVEIDLKPGPMLIRAPRTRFLRAISNVVLNALQATIAGQRVRIRTVQTSGAIEIIVDDGGPGILEVHRSLVFRDGFTTRSDGRGYGLAYVRRVIEEELHGKVWCEDSDLGGVRFVMSISQGEVK